MMRKTIFSVLLTLCSFTVLAENGDPESSTQSVSESSFTDPEQMQLEWCFIYSNRLGYDINYITNPRIYEIVSDWIGTPYSYGGDSQRGIDCSGFVSMLYKEVFNTDLQGGSRDIFTKCSALNRDDLREGDMVFFKIHPSRISHVGVYLGQNKFAHASTQNGVTISDLDEPYYVQRFYKGGRLLP
ncbi:MAG: hypothetical protein RIQ47_410 [Bacteroidota bacterium]|jgi:lipoprotein Spr